VTTIDVKNATKPFVLVLSSPAPMVWRIADQVPDNLMGVILAGPNLQYLDTEIKKPLVMWQDQTAGLYNSDEYAKLTQKIKENLGVEVTGYSGVSIADKPIAVVS